ncbi:MAG TPA: Imm52 family immunity protein [Methylocystis sp.]|nr:Imm52 family immunity protein [Methylocystis sp.]
MSSTSFVPIEVKTTKSKEFLVRCVWERRGETPEELATRFLRMIDSLERIDPIFSLWMCGQDLDSDLEKVRNRYAEEITEGIARDDLGQPEPVYGYRFAAWTRSQPKDRTFSVRCRVGATVSTLFPNNVHLQTRSDPEGPSPEVVAYSIFRAALLAMVDAWEPLDGGAYSQQLISKGRDSYFPKAWIQYLCPWLAQKITPPSTVLAERLPDGGLLMTATTETFDVSNAKHMAVAADMAAAMAPLDRLPWPSQR